MVACGTPPARERIAVLARGARMPVRQLPKIALALVTVVACTSPDRGAANDTSALRASADTTVMTTHQMIEALERDRAASDREMTATEDSAYVFMGDSIATLLKQAHASWEQYRKLECDAIRV